MSLHLPYTIPASGNYAAYSRRAGDIDDFDFLTDAHNGHLSS